MNLMKKFLILLAIFCVIGSAAAVSAEDIGSDNGGYAGYNYDDMNGISESQSAPDNQGISDDSAVGDDTGYVPEANPDIQTPDTNGTAHAAGEPDNSTADNQTAANTTSTDSTPVAENQNMTNATGNATSPQGMPATGNPILALFAVGAVLGSAAVFKRK